MGVAGRRTWDRDGIRLALPHRDLARSADVEGFELVTDPDDADRALDLLIEFMWWVDCTPEPQLELDTAVKWQESLQWVINQWPEATKLRIIEKLRALNIEGRISPEFAEGWVQSVDIVDNG